MWLCFPGPLDSSSGNPLLLLATYHHRNHILLSNPLTDTVLSLSASSIENYTLFRTRRAALYFVSESGIVLSGV